MGVGVMTMSGEGAGGGETGRQYGCLSRKGVPLRVGSLSRVVYIESNE